MAMTEQQKDDFLDLCCIVMYETKPGDAIFLTKGALEVLELALLSLAYDNDIGVMEIPMPTFGDG